MKLHYQIIGQGQPLLILHGLFGSSDNWRMLAKQFAENRQVISVDLRNHGLSPHSDEQNYDVMAADIKQLCDELSLKAIELIGHSLGGKVAMTCAELYPELITKLVIVDMAPRQYQDEHTPIFRALENIELSQYSSRREIDNVLADSIPDSGVRQFLLMNLKTVDKQLQWRINLSALRATYPNMLQAVINKGVVVKPTLFIRGGKSDYIRLSDESEIRQRFANVTLQTIDEAGHWLHIEQPQLFISMVRDFLNHD